MAKKIKKIPVFKSEDEEREFWATHSTIDYLDSFERVQMEFPNLMPSTKSISLRLPSWLLNRVKFKANERDVPYQSYMKMILADHVAEKSGKYFIKKKKKNK